MTSRTQPDVPQEGDPIPKVVLRTPDGGDANPAAAKRPLVLVFLRYIGCPVCSMEMAELARRATEFTAAGADLWVVVDSPHDVVAAAVADTNFGFRLLADPEHRAYDAFGVAEGTWRQWAAPGAASKLAKATLHGHMHGRFTGRERQLPGAFVLTDGRVVYAHRGRHIGDAASVDALLAAVRRPT